MRLEPSFYAIMVPYAALAGFVRGFAGFGGPLVMIPILNTFLAPAKSIPIMMWVDLIANIRLLPEAKSVASWPVIVPLTIGTVAAMPFGVLLLTVVDPVVMKKGISAAILLAAIVLLSGWRYQRPISAASWTAVGASAGFVMGATSIAITAALFLNAGSLGAKESRATFIVWVFLATIALLSMVAMATGFDVAGFVVIAVLAPTYLIGTAIGSRLNMRAPELLVRRVVLALVVAIATVGLCF